MIQEAMKAVAADLNAMLQRRRGDSRNRLILSSLTNQGGAGADEVEDKICFVLTQITEEKNIASLSAPQRSPDSAQRISTPVSLNLQVLFAAQYARYEVGLEMISQVIAYLHAKPLFTRANTPAMNPGLDRLSLEMLKMSYAEQSHLWGMLGAQYTPSVLYSMRMLTFGGGQVEALDPRVMHPAVNAPSAKGGTDEV
jgi:Pvc16 N-terminal domain